MSNNLFHGQTAVVSEGYVFLPLVLGKSRFVHKLSSNLTFSFARILHPGDGGAPAGKLHQFGFTLTEADRLLDPFYIISYDHTQCSVMQGRKRSLAD